MSFHFCHFWLSNHLNSVFSVVSEWWGRCQTKWAISFISITTVCIARKSSLYTSIVLCNKFVSWTLPVVRRSKRYVNDTEIYFSIALDNKALCSYGKHRETFRLKRSLTSSMHRPEVKCDIVHKSREKCLWASSFLSVCLSLRVWMWLPQRGFVWSLMLGLMLKSDDGWNGTKISGIWH
jgi:hypothetical protein